MGFDSRSDGFRRDLKHFAKIFVYASIILLALSMIFGVLAYFRIASYSFQTYSNYDLVPKHKVGLLLGTAPYQVEGGDNEFFTNRIKAAVKLFEKGKIEYILVSGDNRYRTYNEPKYMIRALRKYNIPTERIIADGAGFSTIDSVIRARRVYLLQDVLIISQEFHNERALFIADHHGLKAHAFNALDPMSQNANMRVGFREFFARIKSILDVYILNSQAERIDDMVAIGGDPLPIKPSSKPIYPSSKPKQASDSHMGMMMKQARSHNDKQRAKQTKNSYP